MIKKHGMGHRVVDREALIEALIIIANCLRSCMLALIACDVFSIVLWDFLGVH